MRVKAGSVSAHLVLRANNHRLHQLHRRNVGVVETRAYVLARVASVSARRVQRVSRLAERSDGRVAMIMLRSHLFLRYDCIYLMLEAFYEFYLAYLSCVKILHCEYKDLRGSLFI